MVWHSQCGGTFFSHVTSLGTLEDKRHHIGRFLSMSLNSNSDCVGGHWDWYGCQLLRSLEKINKFEKPTKSQ